jgi:hypothetical protein
MISKNSPMVDALSELSRAHENLEKEVTRSFEKFRTALRPEAPIGLVKDNAAVNNGELVDTILAAAAYVRSQVNRLDELNSRSAL